MTIIEKARELGVMIQQDDRYIAYNVAKEANDSDEELQQMINDFNLLRLNLNAEMSKPDKSSEKIAEYDQKVKEKYNQIMANENMINFTKAQNAMNNLLAQLNNIITYSANGEDPMTCPVETPSCSGSCSTCGGCG
ncbi:MAG: YlbF family regulator [Oscillospiraceae bacterium]|nr:YlbF family regulator [Oscillospiraceae bacterium]MDD7429524.1 YlbF family regulator [Oscillospiraceae bacterium]